MSRQGLNRTAQLLLSLASILVGLILTFIVFTKFTHDPGNIVMEQKAQRNVDEIERLEIPGIGKLDYQRLGVEFGSPGETLDAFALRIGPRLREYSDATGFEACGMLATDGERYGVILGSNLSHVSCVNFGSFVPPLFRSTGLTIHSHGTSGRVRANRSDILLMGGAELRMDKTKIVGGQYIDQFSEMDFQGGAGYLAIPGGAIFQNGSAYAIRKIGN